MANNISEYTSQVDSLRPSDRGISAAEQAGNRINRIYTEEAASVKQAGDQLATGIKGDINALGAAAVQYVDYQDKSKVSAAATSGLANIEQAWQTTIKGRGSPGDDNYIAPADPNDPTVLQRFTEEHINPFLDNLKKIPMGENGQNYALGKADQLEQHLSTQFRADASNLAAKGAILRDQSTTNSLGQLVQTTPTAGNIDFAIKQQSESLDIAKSSGAITAEQALVLEAHKQEKIKALVHTGIMSAATKAEKPEAVVQALTDKYQQYVTPEEQTTFMNAARTITRARAADENAVRTQQERQQKDAAYSRTSQYASQYLADPSKVSLDKMVNDPVYQARPDLLREGIGVIQELRRVQNEGDQIGKDVSQANSHSLMQRITAAGDDPNRIVDRSPIDQAFIDHKINKDDYTFLLGQQKAIEAPLEKEITDARKRFFTDNAMVIDPHTENLGTPTVLGKQQTFAAQQEAIRQENFLRQKGQDPHSLYDPNSPNYFGKQLSRFAVDTSGQLTSASSDYTISDANISRAAAVMKGGLESNGNYQEVSKASADGDKAYGAYQVMGKNVGLWTQQYYGTRLTPKEFLDNKEAQDMVFEGQFGKYMKQYGPIGAARAWYGGEGNMNNLTKTDVYGKLTIGQYGNKFAAGYEGIPHVDASMSPDDVIKKFPGQTIMLSDGRRMVVPGPAKTVKQPDLPQSK